MVLLDTPLLGFDTETTGKVPTADRIVSAALILRMPGACGVTTPRTWLIDPGVEIPVEATAVHGITTAHAREHGLAPEVALEEIATTIAEALASGRALVAFNASFDLTVLDGDLRRHGLATLTERLDGPVAPVIDPLVLDRALDRYRKGKRTLSDLIVYYQVTPSENAMHNADVDTLATLDLLEAMVAAHPQLGGMELRELHEYQQRSHRQWAQDFNSWLASRGRPADVNPDWP